MVLLLWGGAMGVDIGFSVVGSRQAQALADTAALDTARYINLANFQLASANYLPDKLANVKTDNGANNVTFSLVGGYWSNGSGFTTPPAGGGCYKQFPSRNPPCTAVKVTATQSVPRIFAGGNGSVTRTAIAAITPEDGFSMGTYLASLNSQQTGVLNAILSSLGTSVDLTAAGYEGLANSYVTVQQLITASGGILTPGNVLTQNISASQLLSWLTVALDSQQSALNCGTTPTPSVCTAYSALGSLSFGSATTELCQLVSVNVASVNEPKCPPNDNLSEAGLSASLDVLQTLTTEAELANGTSALNVQSALGITGVTGATLSLDLIQPPEIAYGPVGTTTATTAQVSADLQLTLPVLGTLDIPVTAAQGSASLASVTCSEQNDTFSSAVVNASTTTATAALSLAGSPIGTLTMSGAGSTSEQFNSNVVPPTASTAQADPPTNPMQLGTTSPALTVSGLSGTLSPVVSTLLTSTLPGVLGPVLQAAGLSLGGANVADLSYNCGAVSLVQ